MDFGEEQSARPSHVPSELVFDFDLFHDPRIVDEPQAGHMSLHQSAPDIFWTPRNGGHWIATRYADVCRIMQMPDIFSSADARIEPKQPLMNIALPPLDMDGEEHRAHRAILIQFLSPKAIKEREPEISARIGQLIGEVIGNGSCEFVSEIAVPLPATVFMAIMGFDSARYREFVSWTDRILRGGDRQPIRPALDALDLYLRELIEERLAKPRDDAVSLMLASTVDGKPVSPQRVHDMCNLLFLAGLDTITSAMTHMMNLLARDPGLQSWLRSNPQKIPHALEELLRRVSFLNMPRRVTRPYRMGAARFAEGDTIVCSLAAASNDDRCVEDPERIDFTRKGAAHLAFNTGPHLCAGAPLARIELRAFLKQWFEQMPDVAIAPGFVAGVRGGTIMALDSLQLVWDQPQ